MRNSPAHPDSVPGLGKEFQDGIICAIVEFPVYKWRDNFLVFPRKVKFMKCDNANKNLVDI